MTGLISYYQENAGLRENSYKTWDPTQNNSGWKILGFLVIPFTVVYYFVVAENVSTGCIDLL